MHAAPAWLALRAAALDDAQAEPTRGSGRPMSATTSPMPGTRPPTNVTARPTSRCRRRPGSPDNGSRATPPPRPAPRPVPRTVSLAVRPCRVGCVPTLQRALDMMDLVAVITSDADQERNDARNLVGETLIPAIAD